MTTLQTHALDYTADSTGLMRRLATLDKPVFLDSGANAGSRSRFDILAAEPVAHLTATADTWHCSDATITADATDLFAALRALREKYLPATAAVATDAALPFVGGLLGVLGYPALSGKSRFAIRDGFVGVYLWAVIVDHALQRTTFVALDGLGAAACARLRHLLEAPSGAPTPTPFRLQTSFARHLSRTRYDKAFAAIKAYIKAGDCYQVNLTQRVSATVEGDPFAAYLQLRAQMPAPFSAFLDWGEAALISVSPERFVRKRGQQVLTEPIKGTRPRHSDPAADRRAAQDLLESDKDRAENLMIVDLLRNDLGQVCVTGSIETTALFALHSFSNVHHLVSSISGQLAPDRDGLHLLQACFPGGSITGAPKLRAMEIIEQLESAPRRIYCGTVFYLSACGALDSSITIRSLLWESGNLHCWAGGGIVDDSESDAEYRECFDKIDSIIRALSE